VRAVCARGRYRIRAPMELSYLTLKTIHILGSILFVGNIVVTALWKAMADRTKAADIIAFAQRLVTITDFAFTGIGAALVLVTGLLMAGTYDASWWKVGWIAWGLGLFTASGTIWAVVLIPIQVKQSKLTKNLSGGEVPKDYWRLGRLWLIWGMIATILPLINIYFMVFKPT